MNSKLRIVDLITLTLKSDDKSQTTTTCHAKNELKTVVLAKVVRDTTLAHYLVRYPAAGPTKILTGR